VNVDCGMDVSRLVDGRRMRLNISILEYMSALEGHSLDSNLIEKIKLHVLCNMRMDPLCLYFQVSRYNNQRKHDEKCAIANSKDCV
jgi:hypothetical protein